MDAFSWVTPLQPLWKRWFAPSLLPAKHHLHSHSTTHHSTVQCEARPSSHGHDVVTLERSKPDSAGYISASKDGKIQLYYVYYETEAIKEEASCPIILWLQGGPGSSSLYGMLYELGPYLVADEGEDLVLRRNPGTWGDKAGLLFVDQPYGAGFSFADRPDLIPEDVEMTSTTHLYTFLWNFFSAHPHLADRPLIVAGESYAGKFIPSITHFILQAAQQDKGADAPQRLRHLRPMPADTPAPNFTLGGMSIGNGLTDPINQEPVRAELAHALGVIDERQRAEVERRQEILVQQIKDEQWREARETREGIVSYIREAGGLGTLLDVRRAFEYDSPRAVDRFLNREDVRKVMNAKLGVTFIRNKKEMKDIMAGDQMRSVAYLLPDILHAVPCLFYQGQFDLQDGPLGNERMLLLLDWDGKAGFKDARREHWLVEGLVAGYKRCHGRLQHYVVRNAGHMAQTDQPINMKALIEGWMADAIVPAATEK